MNKVSGQPSGYTILETMIFLLVSGILFFSAMLLVNGSQRKAEFETLVRDFDTKLQSIIGNVASGYYNNPGAITCTVNAGPPRTPQISAMASTQGQNAGCTFVGQYIELSAAQDSFTITSYAGLRLNDSGGEVKSLAEARAVPITQTAETVNFLNGVTTKMRIINGADIDTIAITPTFAGLNSNGFLESGSSQVELHAITAANVDTPNPKEGVEICLRDDSGQIGLVYLNNGSTRVKIDNTTGTCPW